MKVNGGRNRSTGVDDQRGDLEFFAGLDPEADLAGGEGGCGILEPGQLLFGCFSAGKNSSRSLDQDGISLYLQVPSSLSLTGISLWPDHTPISGSRAPTCREDIFLEA